MKEPAAPRCESCRFWKKNSGTIQGVPDPDGQCPRLGEKVVGLYWDEGREASTSVFETTPDFGCTLHEPRGES